MAFNTRWLCRLDPWPDHLMRTFTGLREEVYGATGAWTGTSLAT